MDEASYTLLWLAVHSCDDAEANVLAMLTAAGGARGMNGLIRLSY